MDWRDERIAELEGQLRDAQHMFAAALLSVGEPVEVTMRAMQDCNRATVKRYDNPAKSTVVFEARANAQR